MIIAKIIGGIKGKILGEKLSSVTKLLFLAFNLLQIFCQIAPNKKPNKPQNRKKAIICSKPNKKPAMAKNLTSSIPTASSL